uniref:Ammonium_transp domain-containing protein n=1 Tax=Strongyloides venezuelensis TaxID=75913 RepID=A0A0K0FEH6_STRVS
MVSWSDIHGSVGFIQSANISITEAIQGAIVLAILVLILWIKQYLSNKFESLRSQIGNNGKLFNSQHEDVTGGHPAPNDVLNV